MSWLQQRPAHHFTVRSAIRLAFKDAWEILCPHSFAGSIQGGATLDSVQIYQQHEVIWENQTSSIGNGGVHKEGLWCLMVLMQSGLPKNQAGMRMQSAKVRA
jgi:hypothetical protein